MFVTQSIRQSPTTEESVFAFRILGEVSSDEMEALGAFMNDQFERHDDVSMLLIFDRYNGAEKGAVLNIESLKSRLRSLSKVKAYAVVGAPSGASHMIDWMGKLLPLEAKSFDKTDEDAAWRFVGARPD